ncbi:MAG: acyl-CoA dehydrogenase family protein [Clostridia bacterium]|nr:acyl-CoA dehydrogenase family protein [Clostridia bacterium]
MTGLPAELLALRQAVRELAESRIAPRAAEVDRTAQFPWDYVEALRQHDLFRVGLPEAYGGLGLGLLGAALVTEELSRIDAVAGLLVAVQELGTLPIVLAGSEEQKKEFLPRCASGECLAAFGLTEPEAGSDAAAGRTRAVRRGDEYVLDGMKHFVTNAGVAGVYVVFAHTDPAAGARGMSAFIVTSDTPGFAVGRLQHKMGIRGSTTGELLFDGARVPRSRLLGREGDGFRIAMATLDRSRTTIAAQAVGIAQGALDYALAYARERRQFGRPIAEFEGLQFMLADMATRTEAARQLLYAACARLDEEGEGLARLPAEASRLSAMAKLFASDTAMQVTTDAVQVLGGYGYMVEHPVERMMRDAKITQIYEGTNQIQRLVVARSLLETLGVAR